MKGNRWAAALFAVLLFAGGAAIGVLGDRYYRETVVRARPTPEDFRQHYVAESRTRLHLTDSQVKQLNVILDDTAAKIHALREAHHPEMVRIKNEQIQRVRSILTPEQIPAYDKLLAEREQRWKQAHAGR